LIVSRRSTSRSIKRRPMRAAAIRVNHHRAVVRRRHAIGDRAREANKPSAVVSVCDPAHALDLLAQELEDL
jgi:hypothetical protein